MLTAMLFLAAITAQDAPCASDRGALLALDYDSFDQNPDGGWRAVAARDDCRGAAADLIRDYRDRHGQALIAARQMKILYWHEGQLRAFAGQAVDAAALFAQADDEGPLGAAWNAYVDATVAFMRADLAALIDAHGRLEPLTPDAEAAAALRAAGLPADRAMNLAVVEGLIACFDRPYRVAYGRDCQAAFADASLDTWASRHVAGFLGALPKTGAD